VGGQSTTPRVLSAVARYPAGSLVTRDALMADTGLHAAQVMAVMYRAAKRADPPIEIVERGHVWRVLARPDDHSSEPDPDAFSGKVVDRAGGHLIVRDDEGYLYLVKRIGLAED
jgi:hypothetical protein